MSRRRGCNVSDAFTSADKDPPMLEQSGEQKPLEDDKAWKAQFDKDMVADALFMGRASLDEAMAVMRDMSEPTVIELLSKCFSNCVEDGVSGVIQRLISCVKHGVLRPSTVFKGCTQFHVIVFLHASLYAMGLCSARDGAVAMECLATKGAYNEACKIRVYYDRVTLGMFEHPMRIYFESPIPVIDVYTAIHDDVDIAIALEGLIVNTNGDMPMRRMFQADDSRLISGYAALLHALLRRDIGLANFVTLLTESLVSESQDPTCHSLFRAYFSDHEATWLSEDHSSKSQVISKIYNGIVVANDTRGGALSDPHINQVPILLSIMCHRGELDLDSVRNDSWFDPRYLLYYCRWMDPNTIPLDPHWPDAPVDLLRDDKLPWLIASLCNMKSREVQEDPLMNNIQSATLLVRACGRFLSLSDCEFGQRVCTNVPLVAALCMFGLSEPQQPYSILTDLWRRFWRLGPLQLLMIRNRGMLPLDTFLIRHIMRIFCDDLVPLVPFVVPEELNTADDVLLVGAPYDDMVMNQRVSPTLP